MQASSADLHDKIATQYAPVDNLPCADFALLVPLKKSSEYRTIRPRIANPKAIDSWQEEGLHFFVFELKSTNGATVHPSDLPVAVFTMHPAEVAPVSVVVVTPSPDGAEAEVVDLRQPDSAYTAPLLGDDHPAQHQNGDGPSQPIHDLKVDAPSDEQTRLQGSASTGQDRDGDERTSADFALLGPLRQSPEYQAIHSRLADPDPADAWQEDDLHFFVFQLLPVEGAGATLVEPPVAVFTMSPEEPAPVSAVVVTPSANGEEPTVLDLRQPEQV